MTQYVGSGRRIEGGFLVAHKKDLVDHISGTGAHTADNIQMNPVLASPLDGSTVQDVLALTLTHMNDGAMGDGYAHYDSSIGISTTFGEPFDGGTVAEVLDTVTQVLSSPITVGDGVSSFGHFNGVNGIRDALNYSYNQGLNYASIFVKEGAYTWTNPINTMSYAIEGVSRDAVTVTMSSAPTGYPSLTSNVSITFKNLRIVDSSPAAIVVGTQAKLKLEDVSYSVGITINGTLSEIYIDDCTGYDTGFNIDLSVGSAGISNRTILTIRDSYFTTQSTPRTMFAYSGAGSSSDRFIDIVCERCNIVNIDYLFTVNGTYAAIGDLTTSLIFTDCLFSAVKIQGVTGTGSLAQVLFKAIVFNRCDFSYLNNGIYIVPYSFATTTPLEFVAFRDCNITNHTYYAAPPAILAAPADGVWGGKFTISAKRLVIENIKIEGASEQNSTYADVCLFADSYQINGFEVSGALGSAGTGSIPDCRISIYPAKEIFTIDKSNVISRMKIDAASLYTGNNSLIQINGRTVGNGSITFTDCDLQNYSNTPVINIDPTNNHSNIIFDRCYIRNLPIGGGIYCSDISNLNKLNITNSNIDSRYAIDLTAPSGNFPDYGITISHNTMKCDDADTISITMSGFDLNSGHGHLGPIITNNIIYTDDGYNSISINDSTVVSGVVTGNICIENGSTSPDGYISLTSGNTPKYWRVVGDTPEAYSSASRYLSSVDVGTGIWRSFSNAAFIKLA